MRYQGDGERQDPSYGTPNRPIGAIGLSEEPEPS
jgi:hypothetical protein